MPADEPLPWPNATLVRGGKQVTVGSQAWIYPSEAQCLQCHTEAAGRSLGLADGLVVGLDADAEGEAETRRRIVEATVALHTSIGPARTTMLKVRGTTSTYSFPWSS